MIEQHVLYSICISPLVEAHAYMACREKSEARIKEVRDRGALRFAAMVEEHVGQRPVPLWLMTYPLDAKAVATVQRIMTTNAEAVGTTAPISTLNNFLLKRYDYVFTAWFMDARSEDSKTLIELH